jgi:AraC family transcriptional regulator
VRGGLAPWQVRRVTDYLEANLARDVALDELAALVGLSEYHFCTAFRRSAGLPPHCWLTARRMEKAKALMAEGRDGLTEIALAVGCGSQSAFGAAFRRTVGVTPTAWRRDRDLAQSIFKPCGFARRLGKCVKTMT